MLNYENFKNILNRLNLKDAVQDFWVNGERVAGVPEVSVDPVSNVYNITYTVLNNRTYLPTYYLSDHTDHFVATGDSTFRSAAETAFVNLMTPGHYAYSGLFQDVANISFTAVNQTEANKGVIIFAQMDAPKGSG